MNPRQNFFHLVTLALAIVSTTITATAATNYWADVGTAWGTGGNWEGGVTNTSADVAGFTNNTAYSFQPVLPAATSLLGMFWQTGAADVSVAGGSLTLNGVNLGGTVYGIRMDSGAGELGFANNRITLGVNQTWLNDSANLLAVTNVVANSRSLTIAGSGDMYIRTTSGAGTLTKAGTGSLRLTSIAGFTSGLFVNSGTLVLDGTYMPTGTVVGGQNTTATAVMTNASSYLNFNVANSKVTVEKNGRLYISRTGSFNWTNTGQSMVLTNGGSLFTSSGILFGVGGSGGNLKVIGGADGMSLADFGKGSVYIGGSFGTGGATPGTGSAIIDGAGLGALVTNTGFFAVGGVSASVLITNGGWLKTGYYVGATAANSNSYVGYASAATYTSRFNNVTIAGNNGSTNSTWDNNGRTLFVGYAAVAGGLATGNVLTVSTGGIVTNTRLQVGFGPGNSTSNEVALNGGSIYVSTLTVTGTVAGVSGNKVTFNGGTLNVATSIAYSNGTDFVVGDGTQSATLVLQSVGRHHFGAGVIVAANGKLVAGGTMPGSVTVQGGGTLSPGNGVGLLIVPNLTLESTANLAMELGVSSDLVRVTGTTVSIGGANLALSWNTAPTVGNTFLIIDNQTASLVSGEFAGWANLTTQTVSGVSFQIDYGAGDGNDVLLTTVLVVIPEPSSLMLVGMGLLGAVMLRRFNRRRS